MVRRWFDIAISGAGLIVLAIPLGLVALAIRLSSPGPALYRQARVGRGGRRFSFYKFRTMHDRASGSHVTVATDSRITPVGAWLRRLKLDEVPQLWNVLRGDMSLIGPRPEVERFVSQYSPTERRILDVTPGLASRAQLVYPHEPSLLRDVEDPESAYVRFLMPRKIAVDLEYERVRTFRSDVALIGELMLLLVGKTYRVDRDFLMPATARKRAGDSERTNAPAPDRTTALSSTSRRSAGRA